MATEPPPPPPATVKKEFSGTALLGPHRPSAVVSNNSSISRSPLSSAVPVITLSDDDDSSSSGDSSEDDGGGQGPSKRRKLRAMVPLPVGFLAPLPISTRHASEPSSPDPLPHRNCLPAATRPPPTVTASTSKQFWKAGDFDDSVSTDWGISSGGIDHVRVHPKFLHSNATSHKWALGAFAELLDNALDEVCNGATYVNVDMLKNKKDASKMLLIEDNGGGMDPDKMRQCMSLGYSVKSKIANTIGQYGNGFKTSTMRLGADVIVFSRSRGKGSKSPTQSIGMLSYTFLRSTGMEDIVVPMLDYERRGGEWNQLRRSASSDWEKNVATIVQWSPFSSEADLLRQFGMMEDHGTRVIIYNLWEDDQGLLELDFGADPHDIQLRGVNRDEKNILMAKKFPNSRHFLTYRHSLRSYASILYLRLPPRFRMILRGKDIEHHNIVNDMMLSQEVTYRPQPGADGVAKDNMAAVVTIGFVKDAMHHIDVQGFNVYHKNRLIKPFWRLWNPAGSSGRGVIGVLEANFVEPAHDKQGFERTTVLARLEGRLVQMQKNYWHGNCHKIGYASVMNKKVTGSSDVREESSDSDQQLSSKASGRSSSSRKAPLASSDKFSFQQKARRHSNLGGKGVIRPNVSKSIPPPVEHDSDDDDVQVSRQTPNGANHKSLSKDVLSGKNGAYVSPSIASLRRDDSQQDYADLNRNDELKLLKEENRELKERLEKMENNGVRELRRELESERERCRALESQLQESEKKIEQATAEQESLLEIFSEERKRREIEEQNLRKKLKDASDTIENLLNKVRILENMKSRNRNAEVS